MIFMGRKAPSGGGGGSLGRIVLDETVGGAGTQLYSIGGVTPGTGFTACCSLEFTDYTGNQTLIEGSRFNLIANGSNLQFYDGSMTPAAVALPTAGSIVSLMLSVDYGAGLPGSSTLKLWMNGAEIMTSTEASGEYTWTAGEYIVFWATAAAAQFPDGVANHRIWAGTGTAALDPAVHWSSFYQAGTHLPQATLPAGGVVGGMTPRIHCSGAAVNWNGSTDDHGNSIVSDGLFTDE